MFFVKIYIIENKSFELNQTYDYNNKTANKIYRNKKERLYLFMSNSMP